MSDFPSGSLAPFFFFKFRFIGEVCGVASTGKQAVGVDLCSRKGLTPRGSTAICILF